MSTSQSPCAGCKFLRRKCLPDCLFAPYFPPDNPTRFINVHRVFGASNVSKLLNDLSPAQRDDAVNSMAYEAQERLRDPVYGCVGYISLLQRHLMKLERELSAAKRELSLFNQYMPLPAGQGALSLPSTMHRDQQQRYSYYHQQPQQHQQMEEPQQLALTREHERMRSLDQQRMMARLMVSGNSVGGAEAVVAEASVPHIGGYEGALAVLQQEQGGLLQEGSGQRIHHNYLPRRRFNEGWNGEGTS